MSSDLTSGVPNAPATTANADLANASRRLLEDSFNDGNFSVIDEHVAPDATSHDPAAPASIRGLRGPDFLKRTVAMYREAFPDVRMTVEDVIAAGETVVLRWRSEGTHRGGLQGLAPTGARASVTGISIDRWKDGKIVESWSQWDNFGLARQLGAAPPEGGIAEKVGLGAQRLMARRMRRRSSP
ncbi:MAG: ester cyclase [Solirubrobacterales bacterium]|nr:ester cyclase [Solirubrobacterales bacterium]MBV9717505.1 ester cyclase [Solirubrobacterales bacterium]